jgi:hypothetical protein
MLPEGEIIQERIINLALKMYFETKEARKKAGSAKSAVKTITSRENGKKGGRPRKETVITLWKNGQEMEIEEENLKSEDFIV